MDFFSDEYSGDDSGATAVGVPSPYSSSDVLPGDYGDDQAMAPYNSPQAAAAGAPWWAGMAAYGITKAIDNQFPNTPTGVMGNTYPGSFPGANGRTYTNRPAYGGGGVSSRVAVKASGNPLLLVAVAAGAYLLLRK